MKTCILESLADGSLELENSRFQPGSRYAEAFGSLIQAQNSLLETLDAEAKKRFDCFKNASDREAELICISRYIAGFRLGVRIMTEVCLGSDHIMYGAAGHEE